MRDIHGKSPNTNNSAITDEERKELVKKGQFSLKMVEMFCACSNVTKKINEAAIIPPKQLILLMQYLKLASEIIHKDTNDPNKTRTTYLMPAMLDCAEQDELTNPPTPDANNPEPLHITFSFDYVLTGVFCVLITALVSQGPHKILGLTWELVEEGVKRNYVSFSVDDVHKVTLLSHDKSYEIRVVRGDPDIHLHDLCSYVLSAILYIIKCQYQDLVTRIAFQCSCFENGGEQAINHLCQLSSKSRVRFLCNCSKKSVCLDPHKQVWLGKVSVCVDYVLKACT